MSDRLDDSQADRSTIGPDTLGFGSEQCHIDRSSLGWSKLVCNLIENLAEEVGQRRERELGFLLGRRGPKDAPSPVATSANGLCP